MKNLNFPAPLCFPLSPSPRLCGPGSIWPPALSTQACKGVYSCERRVNSCERVKYPWAREPVEETRGRGESCRLLFTRRRRPASLPPASFSPLAAAAAAAGQDPKFGRRTRRHSLSGSSAPLLRIRGHLA
jgi:hypothetical protein